MSKRQRMRIKEKKRKRKEGGGICAICGGRAHSCSGYCLDHLPDDRRCTCTTRRGTRCRLPVVGDSGICKVHLNTLERGYGAGRYGWVYVYDTSLREEGKGIYKIGRSANVQMREQELRQGNPRGKIIFAGFEGNSARGTEASLHKQYREAWLEREMFLLSDEEVDAIKTRLEATSSMWAEC